MKDIVIIGAGGFGREVAWLIEDINKSKLEWNIIGFVDDNEKIQGSEVNGYRVIGNIDWLKKQDLFVVNAIGNPTIKKEIINRLDGSKNRYPVLIHPSVIYPQNIEIGEGSILCAGVVITVNVNVGNHVIINISSTIGHDVCIGNYSTILPNVSVSGFVKIDECVSIGTGSAIIQNLSIGKNTVVGAGSVVIKDIEKNSTAVGVPAKVIKFH